jgi:excisionase family DNA binding protein
VLYSVDQVAEMLGLHVKTVRGYVHDGRLKATKVGRQYRISADDLAAFTGQPVAGRHVDVSVIVQMEDVSFAAMSRISTMVMAFGATPYENERLRVEVVYDEDRATLKVIAVGGLTRTADLLKFLRTTTE